MSLFKQPIPYKSDDFDMSKYMDLSNIKTITYDEIITDISNFKLSGIPIFDMFVMKNLGIFFHNKSCYDKWQICPNLIDEIYTQFNKQIPDCNIQYTDIEKHINKLRKDNADVQSIDTKMDIYMTDFLRSVYLQNNSVYWDGKTIKQNTENNEDNIETYFTSKSIVNKIMKQIKLNYDCEWNNLEKQYENICELLYNNFKDIEDDPKYMASAMLLEKINNDACKYIDTIRMNIVEEIKSEYQKHVVLKSISELNDFQHILNKLKNKFSNEVEKVYEKVLIENKINENIQKFMLELFVIEKSMHQFSLSLDLTELTLSQLK